MNKILVTYFVSCETLAHKKMTADNGENNHYGALSMIFIAISAYLGWRLDYWYWPLALALVAVLIRLAFLPGQIAWWREVGVERDVSLYVLEVFATALFLNYAAYGIGRLVKTLAAR